MSKKYPTEDSAMAALVDTVRSILDDGYRVKGIDPAQVVIEPSESSPPAPAVDVARSGYSGNLSVCCGAPTEQKGTCEYCMACGSSSGCS